MTMRNQIFTTLLATTIATFGCCLALAQTPLPQKPLQNEAVTPRLPPDAPIPVSELEPFVDGVVRAAMSRDHIAGVTVAVVQEGQQKLKKGYGFAGDARPVDPDLTLFRIGSISKTFTWIAAMQEVEAGRMKLDGSINAYLDAKLAIAEVPGWRPVELRDLMSHTPGFEDRVIDMFAETPAQIRPLAARLRLRPPKRVFPPATVSAYSNYGVMLVGEAVSELEGASFQDVIERKITKPLGMNHTSFREPYPARADLPTPMTADLAAELSTPYHFTDGVITAQPTEWLSQVAPAGGGSSTAADMSRYMLMMLGDGELDDARVYSHATAVAFRTPIPLPMPNGGEMDHGFIQVPLPGGFMGYGHDGETLWFQSMMVTVPALRLGVFISANTDSGHELARDLPQLIVAHFYGPPASKLAGSLPSSSDSASNYTGTYVPNRRPYSGLQKFLFVLLKQASVEATPDGYLLTQSEGSDNTWVATGKAGHFERIDGPTATDFALREGAMEWYQPEGTESLVRVGPGYQRTVLLLAVLLTAAAAFGSLFTAARGLAVPTPATVLQRRLSITQAGVAGTWLIALGAFTVFASHAENLRALIFKWPGVPLLISSWAALVASLGSVALLVGLPFALKSSLGWGRWRKACVSLTCLLFCLQGLLLAHWNFLMPWDY
jgi:CubicO group peptidase (beta-lactamase class C family)